MDQNERGTRAALSQSDSTDESIGLGEIVAVVQRHRTVAMIVLAVTLALGLTYGLLKGTLFEYSTVISIGTAPKGDPLEQPESVRAKIVDGFLPKVQSEYQDRSAERVVSMGIRAEIPRNSTVVVLKSNGPAETQAVLGEVHGKIAAMVVSDHDVIQKRWRYDLDQRLELPRAMLQRLREQEQELDAQLRRFEARQELPAREMSFLTSLRLADNKRAQAETVSLMENALVQRSNLRETYAPVVAVRSLHPVGLGIVSIAGLSFLLGAILATVAAFAMEAFRRKRQGR